MSRTLLLDTNIVSAQWNIPTPPWMALYEADLEGHSYAVAAQTEAEIWLGAWAAGWGKQRLAPIEKFFERVLVLPVDRRVAQAWAQVMLLAQRKGHRLSIQDGWVAATAWEYHLPLVTHDARLADVGLAGLEVICHA